MFPRIFCNYKAIQSRHLKLVAVLLFGMLTLIGLVAQPGLLKVELTTTHELNLIASGQARPIGLDAALNKDEIVIRSLGRSSKGLLAVPVDLSAERFSQLRLNVEGLPPGYEYFVFWRSGSQPEQLFRHSVPIGGIGDVCIDLGEDAAWAGRITEMGLGFQPIHDISSNRSNVIKTTLRTWQLESPSVSSGSCTLFTERVTGEPWSGSSINTLRLSDQLQPSVSTNIFIAAFWLIGLLLIGFCADTGNRAVWAIRVSILIMLVSAAPFAYRLGYRAVENFPALISQSVDEYVVRLPDFELYQLARFTRNSLNDWTADDSIAVISDSKYLRHRGMYHLLPVPSYPAWNLGEWVAIGDIILLYHASDITLRVSDGQAELVGSHGSYDVNVLELVDHGFAVRIVSN